MAFGLSIVMITYRPPASGEAVAPWLARPAAVTYILALVPALTKSFAQSFIAYFGRSRSDRESIYGR
jgi:hypothetical protein